MPLFVVYCTDKPDSLALRTQVRPEHRAYLGSVGDSLKIGGPWFNAGGDPVGSMLIVEAGDQAGAEAFAAADPFAKAGLFQSVTVAPWQRSVGVGLPD